MSPSRVRNKAISKMKNKKKKYDPITDNGKTYVYEDDPKEYMKARK